MSINLTVGSNTAIGLNTLTDLKNVLDSNLSLGTEFTNLLDRPLGSIPASLSSANIQLSSGNPSWSVGNFTFTLSGGVSGTVSVITSGDLLSYTDGFATEVATDLTTTTNANPTKTIPVAASTAFVCVALDFSIQGGISGNFTSGTYGVSSSVSANETFSIAFYKKCRTADLLQDALIAAFSDFVLPLHPHTLGNLKAGDYLHHNFNANLQLGLGASIGIDKVFYAGQYKADIPGTAGAVVVNASVQPEIQAGAKLAFSFGYGGQFETLLWKDDANTGHLHLYRAATQDTSLGLHLGVTLLSGLDASANVMTDQIGARLVGLFPPPLRKAFSDVVWPKASEEITKYVTDANNKVSGWLQPLSQAKATLDFAIEKTNQKFLLMDYTFDLTAPAIAAGWNAAIHGRFLDALEVPGGGVSIAIGSGLENFYNQKTSVTLNLFGKLTAAWTSAIISNSSLVYVGNNIFHLITNEGRQLLSTVNNRKREIDFYFAAEVDLSPHSQSLATVNLHCILRATNNTNFGGYIAKFLRLTTTGMNNVALTNNVARMAMQANTTQLLHLVFTPPAYGRLVCSTLPKKAADDTTGDQKNYAAFAKACSELFTSSPANFLIAGQSSYKQWCNWNIACNKNWPAPDGAFANRSQPGNTGGAAAMAELHEAFPGQTAQLIGYAFEAQSDFLNFCDALVNLAGAESVVDLQHWDNFVARLKSIMKNDVSPDFINPMALALTRLVAGTPPMPVVGPAPGLTDQNSIAVTMTYS